MFEYAIEYKELVECLKKVILIDGKKILLTFLDGKIYAIQDHCTHLGVSLSKGTVENQHVTCKAHGATFNLITGEVIDKAHIGIIKMPTKKALTYETKVENGKVFIKM